MQEIMIDNLSRNKETTRNILVISVDFKICTLFYAWKLAQEDCTAWLSKSA